MPDALVLAYVALSLVVGGVAATIGIWERSALHDRADGRGKFASPKMTFGEALFFGVFVALVWPVLAVATIVDRQ